MLLLLTLAGCAPKPEAGPAEALALNCSQDFEAQKAAITGQPGLNPAPKDPAEPYRFYSTADGHASWLITEPDAPGHPAILMQVAKGSEVITTGCPYGDKAGYDKLHAYLDSLKSWRRK
ncbi:MAG: hypothetical protein ACJ798_00435 [Phenylobacterium sp.]